MEQIGNPFISKSHFSVAMNSTCTSLFFNCSDKSTSEMEVILAMNAAIVAAHAVERGKVADEIRILAEDTANLFNRIRKKY